MPTRWISQNADPFLLQPDFQDPLYLDMNNLFDFDDNFYAQPDGCVPTELSDSLDFQAQDLTESPYTTMSSLTQSQSPISISSNAEFDSITPSLTISERNSPTNDWLLNPSTGEITLSTESTGRDASKRARGVVDDTINACWKSPLCPNKKEDGSRPDHCSGECADYLFAHPSELPDDKKILSELLVKSEPKVMLQTPSSTKQLKRHERDSTPEITGRTLLARTTSRPRSPVNSTSPKHPIIQQKTASSSQTPKPRPVSTSIVAISAPQKPKGRVPHNQVEKKYRENVNAQLEALRRVVPVSKQQLVGFDGLDIEDLPLSAQRQPSKAVVLSSATAYIKQLEKENRRLQEELSAMKTQNKTLQSLVKCDDCSLMNYARQWKIRGPA